MNLAFLALVPAALLASLTSPAQALQTGVTSQSRGEVNGWSLRDSGRGWCTAFGPFRRNVYMRLGYRFGNDTAELYLFDPAWASVRQGAVYQVGVKFSNGADWPGSAQGVVIEDGGTRMTGLGMSFAGRDFLDDFAGAGSVEFTMGRTLLGAFSLQGSREMVTRLVACSVASFRRDPPDPFAGTEPAAAASLGPAAPRSARANLNSYFSADDYPAAAMAVSAQGTTAFALTIGPNGRVTDCQITASSGSVALDETTCRILRARARYTPARDRGGNPTIGVDSGRVTWRLPAEQPPPELPQARPAQDH